MFPEGSAGITRVIDVAPGGRVVGQVDADVGKPRFFVWQDGERIQFLETGPETSLVSLRAIAPSGLMIGQIETGAGQRHAILLSGKAPPLILPGVDKQESRAVGLNSKGDVVGVSEGNVPQAVLWPASGDGPVILSKVVEPALPPGFTLLRADDINDAGTIIANAVDADGGVYLVRLTPDPNTPDRYVSIILGQILTDATALPGATLAVSETGSVFGTCGADATNCPRPFNISVLDPSITNLVPFANQPPGFLPLISDRILRGEAIAGGTPTSALLETPNGTTSAATTPFGPTTFPGVTGGGGGGEETPSAPTTAPIPLPAAFWLLASAMLGVFGARLGLSRRSGGA